MKRRVFSAACFVLLLASLAMAQAGGEKPDGTTCKPLDEQYISNFNLLGVVFGGLIGWFLGPLLIPKLLGFRWWWLIRPIPRWAILADAAAVLLLGLFVILPAMASSRTLSPGTGLLMYPGVDPKYLDCGGVPFESERRLLGFLSDPNSAAIGQTAAAIIAAPRTPGTPGSVPESGPVAPNR